MEGLVLIEPKIFEDERGFFFEFFSKRELKKLGIEDEFVQGNHSKSNRGVLRGLHFQKKQSQGKLVRVLKGAILDVVVDLRKNSKTFSKYYKVELSGKNRKMIFVPKGFAHGFLTLEDDTEVEYMCTDYYAPEHDSGIVWNDEELNIDWEFEKYKLERGEITLSEKDRNQQSFRKFLESGGDIS
ncbi:MAG: dTDP-4-dehydrorhamnose 3,5-epimerase [Cetobacterium sp.]